MAVNFMLLLCWPVILVPNGAGKAMAVFPNRVLKRLETGGTIMNKK